MPAEWLSRLNRLQLSAVLVHELVHIKRHDHWVRWLEFVVTGLYWWNPVVWIARSQLRKSEELCCDAWVLTVLPASRKTYANALVDMVDFVSAARSESMPLVSGFGHKSELERRIYMIMQSKPQARIGVFGAMPAVAMSLLLPLGIARSEYPDDPPAPPPPERRDDRPPPPPGPSPEERRREDMERRERERARAEKAREEAERTRAAAEQDRRTAERSAADGGNRRIQAERIRLQLREAELRLAETQEVIRMLRARLHELEQNPSDDRRPQPDRPRAPDAERRPRPDAPGRVAGPDAPRPPRAPEHPPVDNADNRRFEALQRQLEMLQRELAELRRDRERDRQRDQERRPPN